MNYYSQHPQAFAIAYINDLRGEILACPYLTINNLNRDFIDTKGFSVVFQRSEIAKVKRQFPFFKPYLDLALQPTCNAFYLNPLLLQKGSRVIRISIALLDLIVKLSSLLWWSAFSTYKFHPIYKAES